GRLSRPWAPAVAKPRIAPSQHMLWPCHSPGLLSGCKSPRHMVCSDYSYPTRVDTEEPSTYLLRVRAGLFSFPARRYYGSVSPVARWQGWAWVCLVRQLSAISGLGSREGYPRLYRARQVKH